jgi:hypothetical protein
MTLLVSHGGEHLGVYLILLTAQCSQHLCTCSYPQQGLCGICSMTIVEVLCVSGILMSSHLEQRRCILRIIPRCNCDLEGVKFNCKSLDDSTKGVVAAVSHISLLHQCLCVRCVLLTLPLGQCGGLHGLHPLGVFSVFSSLSKAHLVDSNHPVTYDCAKMGQGKGSGITACVLRGMLRGFDPAWLIQEDGRGGRKMSQQ